MNKICGDNNTIILPDGYTSKDTLNMRAGTEINLIDIKVSKMNSEIMGKVLTAIQTETDTDIKQILQSWLNTEMVKQELMFE